MASTTVRKVGVKLIRLSRAVTRIRTSAQAEGLRRTSQSNVLKISARLHEPNGGVPYGIALAAAALLVYPSTVWMTSAGP